MEIRRIQKTGVSTMTVSLPKEWVDQNNLKPGDPVGMNIQLDGTITVEPRADRKREAARRVIWVDREETSEHLTRKLIGAYLAGYNILEIRSKERLEHGMKHTIKEFARLVIGPEVIEETANTVVLHDLSDPVELPQEKCVRRMHLLVKSMHSDAIEALIDGDADLAHDIVERDADVDRLYWMVVKQYNLIVKDRKLGEKIGVDINEGMNLVLVARVIERIGDHAEKIARNAQSAVDEGLRIVEKDTIRGLSHEALAVLDKAVESYFRKNIKSANAVVDKGNELVVSCEELIGKLRSQHEPAAIIAASVLDSIIRTTMYAVDVAEIAINEAMKLTDQNDR
jgi:phosphate uptake regulator